MGVLACAMLAIIVHIAMVAVLVAQILLIVVSFVSMGLHFRMHQALLTLQVEFVIITRLVIIVVAIRIILMIYPFIGFKVLVSIFVDVVAIEQ